MTARSMPPPATTGGTVFEVERFEWTAPDRLELAGRWFGVRGMRVVGPTLSRRGDELHRRLLADLEHKPWNPEDGELWLAVFPWVGDPVAADTAELAVAPSIAVDLPAPRAPRARRAQRAPPPQRAAAARAAAARERAALEHERDEARRDRERALRERD